MTSVELRRWVMIAGSALIALIIGADSYEAWADYHRVITDNEHLEVALSRAVTEQTARMIQEVDVVISGYGVATPGAATPSAATPAAATPGAAKPGAATAEAAAARRLLLERIMRLPFVRGALVTGGDGQVLASTDAEPRTSWRDTDAFKSARADSLYIDRPDESAQRPRTFALSKALGTGSGDRTFSEVAIARIGFDYLANFYSQISVTPDTSIRLIRDDGVTLAQYPPPPRPSAGTARPKRIEAAERVPGYPISVVVSRSSRNVLRPWVQEEESSAARTISLSVLAGILLTALRSALNRQEKIDLQKSRLELELAGSQRVEALGFLAASVAHDFNNVLTAIIGYAELAGEDIGSPASRDNIERLLAATERARLLVRRVLTFDPRRSVSYRATSIAPIAMEVAEQVRATLPPAIEMRLKGMEHAVSTLGDATEMYQVVMNLCSNAIHAMPKGGALDLGLEILDVERSRSLALGQLQAGRWARLSVTDTGIGLAAEQTLSIFEPFYTTRSTAHGTGIGLTVVRNIILRMNGALDVSSVLGEGTRMAVYWRVTDSPVAPTCPARLQPGSGETILVVDDERELVALTEELLASLSYEPVGFSDARAALEVFRADPQRFDAILTDERMHPMGGLEFARLAHGIDPDLPIILMTAHRDRQIDVRAAAEGIVEILDKPVRVQTLREALGRGLAGARSR